MEKNIINALHRLERLGQENSRMTEKAREAANKVEVSIVEIMPVQMPLPMGYIILSVGDRDNSDWCLMKECHPEENDYDNSIGPCDYLFGKGKVYNGSRSAILQFSEDLANGLLDKFADFLEKRKNKMAAAEKIIREATEEI